MENLVWQYFTEHVRARGQQPCMEWEGRAYPYAEVHGLVLELIKSIQGQGLRNRCVVVPNEHSVYNYAALLAILATGNAFLPIDTAWPPARIHEVLAQVRPGAMLLDAGNEKVGAWRMQVPALAALPLVGAATLGASAAAEYPGIAYILFTSGSTGVPKGVPVSVANLNGFVQQVLRQFDFSPADRFLQVYELTFDVAYFSIFIPIAAGACCCLLRQHAGVPKSLSIINDLAERNISVVSMVPTVIHLAGKFLRKAKAPGLRHCFFIGDALLHSEAVQWQAFTPNAQLHNFYGPTEATIACADYLWRADAPLAHLHGDIVCIGKVFENLSFKIITEAGHDAAGGEPGELLLAGNQVVSGYIGGVQSERFLALQNEAGQEAIYYRTGDLVQQTADGNLLFMGRIDHQVKLNGYRIELAEVQMAITKATGQKAVVVKAKMSAGHYGLRAFIAGRPSDVESLKNNLQQQLPPYMVPEQFSFVQELPLNANGKIDYPQLQNSNG